MTSTRQEFKTASDNELIYIDNLILKNKEASEAVISDRSAEDGTSIDEYFSTSREEYIKTWNEAYPDINFKYETSLRFAWILITICLASGLTLFAVTLKDYFKPDFNPFYTYLSLAIMAFATIIYLDTRGAKKKLEMRVNEAFTYNCFSTIALAKECLYISSYDYEEEKYTVDRVNYNDIQASVITGNDEDGESLEIFTNEGVGYSINDPISDNGENIRTLLSFIKARTL